MAILHKASYINCGDQTMQSVRVRILFHDSTHSVVEYKNKVYSVNNADLHNVNAGWTYGWIAESKLVNELPSDSHN